MAQKSDLDELIKRITLYETSSLFHGYVRPFLILYFICFFVWYFFYGLSEHFEEGMIAIAVIGVLQILTYLSCHWSINVRCLLSYKKESNILKANYVKVVPAQNNGSPELVKLCKVELKDKQTMPDSSEILGFCTRIKISESIDELYKLMKKERVKHYNIWFEFQKTKYIFNRKTKKFEGLTFPDNYNLNVYQNWKGLDEEGVAKATDQYGQNKQEMVVPSFFELFAERATAPFFVFQVFCIGLWCLDDYWYYSLFSLVTLITFEYFIVLQQIKNISYIRNMGNKSYKISVYRNTQWIICESSELVPGDILSIGQGEVPCDALLLRGSCIVNESMLTGESVPQMKVPIEFLDSDEQLDMNQHNRPHVLFGGTKVLQYTPPLKTLPGLKSPDNGCIAYVLRTGFNTSQGKLLRTILFGVKRVTANNLETFYFILFLLVFAIGASTNVWIKGIEDPKKKWYKLFLECCLILTSVVPPELPMVLSFAVNTSLLALTKFNIFCTEPFRIPLAGKVEICCFDKTGTLTSNNLTVEGIAGLFDGDMQTKSIPASTIQVLACCHSLVQLDNELVGDPLEKVMFEHVDFILSEDDCVKPRQGDMSSVKIHHRFHFSSSVKRMSVIASYIPHGLAEPSYFFATKGAPEILKPMFSRIPQNYDEIYLALTRRGARVLALGRKDLGQTPNNNGRLLSIDALERDLQFKGFLVLSCPLKSDSKAIIKTILDATYHVVMITGDAPFTACHVAKELKFTRHRLTLIFTPPAATESHWWWVSIDGTTKVPGVMTKEENIQILIKNFNLCLTGEGMVYLLSKHPTYFRRLLPYICVFARVAPKQKEKVITELKTQGFHTLMCGDGTNDVGALKHADVGVAIFSAVWQKIKPKETEDDNASNGKVGQRSDTRSKESSHENGHIPAESNKGNDEQNNTHLVKLGDASIAAPFTSKLSSIQCVFHIIKQGRCTLVTTLQMFKILALNALILAYCQSVLYLNGIKFSDLQATFQGLLLAACFLCISNSKPLKTLSKERPLPNIFNLYTVLTVLLQFAIHFQSLVYLVDEATARSPPRSENFVDLDSKFKPSLLNSTVYITSMSLQVSTFAINYRGNPFMVNLSKNKPLLSTIAVSALAIFFLLIGFPHNLVDYFYVVHFPFEFQHIVVSTLYLDFVFAFVVDRVTLHFFGYGKLRVA